MSSKVAAVVGVGKGIGGAVARRFAKEGFKVAIIARNETYKGADKLTPLKETIEKEGGSCLAVKADATDEGSVKEAFQSIREQYGPVDVLVYNAGARKFEKEGILETSVEQFVKFWNINCLGAFLTSREVVPAMKERGCGTILFTGATASFRSSPGLCSFAVGKFGLRALAKSMAAELGPQGIHVAHVIIDGPVDIPILRKLASNDTQLSKRLISSEDIASQYWHLHCQPPSCWTFELDIRSSVEPLASL